MRKPDQWDFYRVALRFVRPGRKPFQGEDQALRQVFRRHRVMGATLARFDERGVEDVTVYGYARKGMPAAKETIYRAASVSKLITALGVMRLVQKGRLSLDMDISEGLPFELRHPNAPETPITLRMLLTHTAGIHDGADYNKGIQEDVPLSRILSGNSFSAQKPGEKWEYSNLGAGIVGSVLEGVTGLNFDTLMNREVFSPLDVKASFYPQRLGGPLADAWRILPAAGEPGYDAAARLARPLPKDEPDPEAHYMLAHGNLCVTAPGLATLGRALMNPGFLRESELNEMRAVTALFGVRAANLSQGIGTFVLRDETIAEHVLYGHQGLAYGAVHGLFFDPERQRGFALLTSGASEARRGVLTDLNADLIRLLIG